MKFNVIVTGCGGQGILTLGRILARAAFLKGYEVKTCETHGLSQRYGSLQFHLRFGERIFSPLIKKGDANLVISLEGLESLRVSEYANKQKTILLLNKQVIKPVTSEKEYDFEEILEKANDIYHKVYVVDAPNIIKELGVDIATSNVLIAGYGVSKGLIPLEKEVVWKAITQRIRPQFLEINKKAFEKAFEL